MQREIHKNNDIERLYIPDALFETNNDLEIPCLRLDVQPKYCDIPFLCYGEQKRTFDMNNTGTLHFYTDDYRYADLYDHPEKILKQNPRNIVEPNFSLYNETPIAFGVQSLYRKRWLGRMLQEKGIGVFVDLNVAAKFYKLNLLGVPFGYSAFCTRGYSDRLDYLEFEYKMAKSISGDNPLLFVVYNGGQVVKDFCKANKCIYVNPVISIKNKIKAMQKIHDSIAFIEEEYNINNLVETETKRLFNNQIENFSEFNLLNNDGK